MNWNFYNKTPHKNQKKRNQKFAKSKKRNQKFSKIKKKKSKIQKKTKNKTRTDVITHLKKKFMYVLK